MTDHVHRLTVALEDRYRIERELGAGGMATVYLADDLKHNRKVALKILRPELAAVIGAERFLNEITVTANLQHPHILQLYDSGEVDGVLYYVMPYVEGESLRDRLQHEKQLSVEETINITRAVASALTYAHKHGVIHRDIKPENILLVDDQPIVADFGIALAVTAAGGTRLTETGLSLGTPHYMSPEQAMGDRDVDARSDVYALGCVVYEMLAGEPPYTGPTAQAIVAKLITEKPQRLALYRDTVPAHVEAVVHKALAKLPADRFATPSAFAEALTRPSVALSLDTGVTGEATARPVGGRRALHPSMGWAVAVAALGLAAWGWLSRPPPAPPQSVKRFVVTLPASEQIGEAPLRLLAVAPDGSGFVYVGVGPNGNRLYYRPFDTFRSRALAGTEDAVNPFFSPDGEWIAFTARRTLWKVALAGGPPVRVRDDVVLGGSWGRDDRILVTGPDGLQAMSAEGGDLTEITRVDTAAGELRHRFPYRLPDDEHVLFEVVTATDWRIAVASMRTGDVRYLLAGGTPTFAPTGHLVFVRGDTLWGAPFDVNRREVTGSPVALELEATSLHGGIEDFALAPSGALVYVSTDDQRRALVEVDRQGRERVLVPQLQGYNAPRYSPDGSDIAMRIFADGFHIWTLDVDRGTFLRLTFDGLSYYPSWTPDGRRVAWVGRRQGGAGTDLYWKNADGSGGEDLLLTQPQDQWDPIFTPDGRYVIYRQNDSVTGRDLWAYSLTEQQPRPVLATEHSERAPQISPDGGYLAYVSDETGRAEVYVRSLADSSGRWLVSTDGGTEPLWAPSGRELFYRHGDWIMAIGVETRPTFAAGAPERLFQGPYVPNANHTNYDIHPDGDRFLMVRSGAGELRAVVMLNWLTELGNRVRP